MTRPRSIPPITSTGGSGRPRSQVNIAALMAKFIEQVPALAEHAKELQQRLEEAQARGEDITPQVQSGISGHILGRPIGGGPPGGGQGSSQYGDDPDQHTDQYGAGYGRQRGAGMGAGGIKRSQQQPIRGSGKRLSKEGQPPAPALVERPDEVKVQHGIGITFPEPVDAESVKWEQHDDVLDIEHEPSGFHTSILLASDTPVVLEVKEDGRRFEWEQTDKPPSRKRKRGKKGA